MAVHLQVADDVRSLVSRAVIEECIAQLNTAGGRCTGCGGALSDGPVALIARTNTPSAAMRLQFAHTSCEPSRVDNSTPVGDLERPDDTIYTTGQVSGWGVGALVFFERAQNSLVIEREHAEESHIRGLRHLGWRSLPHGLSGTDATALDDWELRITQDRADLRHAGETLNIFADFRTVAGTDWLETAGRTRRALMITASNLGLNRGVDLTRIDALLRDDKALGTVVAVTSTA